VQGAALSPERTRFLSGSAAAMNCNQAYCIVTHGLIGGTGF
jgi:hypothetical protein